MLSNAKFAGRGDAGIKMGDILTKEELDGGKLMSGRGVVVKKRGTNYFAVGDEHSAIADDGKDTLRKNLIGARYNDEEAFLVTNVDGVIRWEEGSGFSFSKKGEAPKPDASRFPAFGSQIRI